MAGEEKDGRSKMQKQRKQSEGRDVMMFMFVNGWSVLHVLC